MTRYNTIFEANYVLDLGDDGALDSSDVTEVEQALQDALGFSGIVVVLALSCERIDD